MEAGKPTGETPPILFDGKCRFCSGMVNFIRKRSEGFSYIPLQSEEARSILDYFGLESNGCETFVLVEEDTAYVKSEAAARIMKQLEGLWYVPGVLLDALPRRIGDLAYSVVARNRYLLSGGMESCSIPGCGN